jgi:hypothetical protein
MAHRVVDPAAPEAAMSESRAPHALTASALALAAGVACIAAFLPPMLQQTLSSLWRTVVFGGALVVALLLHWVYLGIGAHRLGRPPAGWVALSVLLFPIGSAAALGLLGLVRAETPEPVSVPGA